MPSGAKKAKQQEASTSNKGFSGANLHGHEENGSQDEKEIDGNVSSPGSQGNEEFGTKDPSAALPSGPVEGSAKEISGAADVTQAIDWVLGGRFMSQVRESASSVLEFSRQWEEYDEAMRLAEESLRKQAVELQKKEERLRMVEEREKKIKLLEDSITERLGVLHEKEKDANMMRSLFEEAVTHLKAQEKLLQDSMLKKHEEQMRDLQVRKQELEARDNELRLLNETIKERSTELEMKEDKFQLKQKAEAREIKVKSKLLKQKEKVLEEREKVLKRKQKGLEEQPTKIGETSKRSRHKSEPSVLANKGRDADSHIHIGKKHKPVREHSNHDDKGKEAEVYEVVCIDDEVEEDPEPYNCPDPDFNDFKNTMRSFAVDQVWALYDPLDQMPRYYAQIRRVSKRQLSVEVTWLESENEKPIPIACGGFKYGDSEIQSLLAFSHKMHHIKSGRNVTTINPRKGETWALFRDWTRSWTSDKEQHEPPYNYDFVEVQTEFDSDQGIGVAYLRRVEGFTSVYKLTEQHGLIRSKISSDQMLRFSHRVPSFRLSGYEKKGVPAGSFELDPAAIPRAYLKADKVKEEKIRP